ncbi:MoaD/ThiS family protein [Xenorhabdus littoralis]|uniref:MoaD/ThiS family protein n=1 Tax=Xenorhabdus littoralis TaxID=2582835 RepID=UPI0029E7E215|nr:MoaD/ThiS family protein [Xenorhabdus sp. psl]MDX7991000.1 MoaD/ThiS family protein [Xenorhabdus sp. psl]
MSVMVHIPTILRTFTNNQKTVTTSGESICEVINNLDIDFPGIKDRLVKEEEIHGFINLYVNDDDIRFGEGLKTTVKVGDVITILPAVAGG